MTASIRRLSTAGSTNLTLIDDDPTKVTGLIAVNTAAYAIFIKLYWFLPTTSAEAPTVGTTAPNMTIMLPALSTTTGGKELAWPDGFSSSGKLYMAVTKLAADNDTTAVLAGDGLISLLYE